MSPDDFLPSPLPPPLLPPSPADVERALREADPNAGHRVSIACSFVFHDLATKEWAAYALVDADRSGGGGTIAFVAGAEICVNGWPVFLVSRQSPIGRAAAHAEISDPLGGCVIVCLPQNDGGGGTGASYEAQMVSWNGSPLLSNAECDECREKAARQKAGEAAREAVRRKQAAVRAKQDGVVAELRARRLAKEALMRDAAKRVE